MKISKLFHWLYAILMFLPFGLLVFNALASMWSGVVINYTQWTSYMTGLIYDIGLSGASDSIYQVYFYLVGNVFGLTSLSGDWSYIITMLLTYWTCISIIWLVFDVFMYVPLLVHRWIDKAKLE